MNSAPAPAGTLRSFLKRDHARLEGLHARLLDELGDDPARQPHEVWRRFREGLLDHMAAEERYLFRRFGLAHRREADTLRADHAELRTALARLAARSGVDREELERLIAAVCAHGRREDHLLYRWAEQEVDTTVQERIARELSTRERAAALGRRR